MKLGLILVVVLLPAPRPAQRAFPTEADWATAERAIVRLQPSAFADLPSPVRAELERRRCRIPQLSATNKPHNVIRGRFTSAAPSDIAVLCSVDGVSSVLVFPSGNARHVAALAPAADVAYLQTGGPNTIEFSRAIQVATPQTILAFHEGFGSGPPPRVDHDGINDYFVNKSSTVHYWTGRAWVQLQGAD